MRTKKEKQKIKYSSENRGWWRRSWKAQKCYKQQQGEKDDTRKDVAKWKNRENDLKY